METQCADQNGRQQERATHRREAWQTMPDGKTSLPAVQPPLPPTHSDNGLQKDTENTNEGKHLFSS